jgi:type IV secretion system protein VirB4
VGIAHESADDDDINVWHEKLNYFYRNIASPDIAVWTNIIRRTSGEYPASEFTNDFTKSLNEKYKTNCIDTERLLVNELYISIIFRPAPNKVAKLFSKLESISKEDLIASQHHAIEKLDEIADSLLSSLDRYEPTRLSIYEHKGKAYSEMLEFYAFLINGEWQRMPLPKGNLRRFLATSRPFFGNDTLAIHTPTDTIYGAFLGVKEYPSATAAGMLDEILSHPYEFIITQSFTFKTKQSSQGTLTRQKRIMVNAGDLAESQIEEIDLALDDLISNRFVMGDYHFSMLVLANDAKTLRENIGYARTALSDTGTVIAREDLAIEAAYYAQLAGNFSFRPRIAPVSSRNFCGLSSFHNYPAGKAHGNHWGDAVTLLKTASGAPYYFNFHRADLGNTLITGPSGSGKTVAQGFLLAQLQKFDPTSVFFDKDEGAKIFVKAMGGNYHSLKNGVSTGWNPLQLEPTEKNMQFLESFIKKLAGKKDLTIQEEKEIGKSLTSLMLLPKNLRRLTQLINFFDPTNPEGIYYRLQRWTSGNAMGWMFDSETDSLDFTVGKMHGFDMTQLLDNDEARTPALMYLMFCMESVIDGRRFVCFMDEFWKLLLDDVFEDFAQNKLKVIRKQNGFLVFGTQSPRDTLQSPIAHTIIEQSPTQIFMPNPKASHKDYVEGFHLSEREYQIVKELPEESRMFLIKQGHNSVIAELNLKGFSDELAVLSGTTANSELLDKIIAEVGDNPKVWLPIFQQRRKSA